MHSGDKRGKTTYKNGSRDVSRLKSRELQVWVLNCVTWMCGDERSAGYWIYCIRRPSSFVVV